MRVRVGLNRDAVSPTTEQVAQCQTTLPSGCSSLDDSLGGQHTGSARDRDRMSGKTAGRGGYISLVCIRIRSVMVQRSSLPTRHLVGDNRCIINSFVMPNLDFLMHLGQLDYQDV